MTYLHEIADLAERRDALLRHAADILQRLLREIDSPATGTFAALGDVSIGYTVSFQLALRHLRLQIVRMGQPDWARQLAEVGEAAYAIRKAAEIAQQAVTVDVKEDPDGYPRRGRDGDQRSAAEGCGSR